MFVGYILGGSAKNNTQMFAAMGILGFVSLHVCTQPTSLQVNGNRALEMLSCLRLLSQNYSPIDGE